MALNESNPMTASRLKSTEFAQSGLNKIRLEKPKKRWVSTNKEWEEMHNTMAILWPGMKLEELKSTMEEAYGFCATYVLFQGTHARGNNS